MGFTIYAPKQDGSARFNTLQVQLTENALLTKVVVADANGKFYYSTVAGGTGTVTSISVINANGLNGTVSNPTTTPAITLSTTVTGILKGNGTAITAATPGTDYLTSTQGTASWAQNSVSSSYALTASYALNVTATAISASYASTASSATNFIVGSSITASNALITSTITAQTLVVQVITSSVEYSSGSNIFGSKLTDTQQLTGSVSITGSLIVVGQVSASGFTGSLFGTASWALNFITSSITSASFASTASLARSASYAATASSGDNFLARGTITGASTLTLNTYLTLGLGGNNDANTVSLGRVAGPTTGATRAVAIGYTALAQSTGIYNIAIGYGPWSSLGAGGNNIGIGQQVGYLWTAGNSNTLIIPSGLGLGITSGNFNTIIGAASGSYPANSNNLVILADGNGNNRFYYDGTNINLNASNSNVIVNANLRVSGSSILTGSLTATNGITGSLFGTASWAQNAITSSYPISVIGSTLRSVSPAGGVGGSTNNSIFLGAAGGNATNANFSNFLGNTAGSNATDAQYSNFLGNGAGRDAFSASHSNFFGRDTGFGASSASYSTLIGFQVGYSPSGPRIGSNNIIIGTNITLPELRQNSINLGAIIFATDSYSNTGGAPFSGSANGRVGINVVNPTNTLEIAGNVSASSFTGSLLGTASWAQNAITASYVLQAVSASFATTAASATTASYVLNAVSASFASTASFVTTAQTASYVLQAVSASNANLLDGLDSTVFATTGSNTFRGNQTITGSVNITGSTTITGSLNVSQGITSSLQGTASWANNAISSSFAQNAITSSYPISVTGNTLYSISPATSQLNTTDTIALGRDAGFQSTSASNSNFLGRQAGGLATLANDSNFLGYLAGYQAYTASYSNFFGQAAGQAANKANDSNFFGVQAGYQATLAPYSNFIGRDAGFQAQSSSNSNFLGRASGYTATNASDSNFLGYQAGYQAISSSNSNFLGYQAGYLAALASNSNFFGRSTGYGATQAPYSNFLGYQAGFLAISASNSNFLGQSSGESATNANNSNFLGQQAGLQASLASYSNFLGYYAGYQATSASNSNFLGYNAGYQAVSAFYSNFLGYQAGIRAASASYSILLGYNVGRNVIPTNGIGPYNIVIGTNITLADNVSRAINIGGILFGSGSYNTTSGNPFSGSANGRIGINQTLPEYALDVSGSIRTDGPSNGLFLRNGFTADIINPNINTRDIQFNQDTTGTVMFKGNGNVGIGTTSPSYKLDVVGDIIIPNGSYYYARRNTSNAAINVLGFAASSDTLTIKGGTSGGAISIQFQDTNGTVAVFYNGNLGIGTTSPGEKLDVSGSVRLLDGGTLKLLTAASIQRGTIQALEATGAGNPGLVIATSGGEEIVFKDGTDINMVIKGNGSVGIGTTAPSQKLHIYNGDLLIDNNGSGDTNSGIRIVAPISTTHYNWMLAAQQNVADTFEITPSTAAGGTTFSTPVAVFNGANGRVGIGTTAPSQLLEVVGGEIKAGRVDTGSEGGQVSFGRSSDNATGWYIDVYGSTSTPELRFVDVSNSSVRMSITGSGEVYIAGSTDQGAYNLQVNGTGVWGAGAYVNGSDIRLKENIKDISPALDLVNKLKPKTFNYKESYSKDRSIQTGFIAQDLQEVFANEEYLNGIVHQGNEHLNVAYQNLIPLLTKAIQELKAEIDILKNKT